MHCVCRERDWTFRIVFLSSCLPVDRECVSLPALFAHILPGMGCTWTRLLVSAMAGLMALTYGTARADRGKGTSRWMDGWMDGWTC